MKWLHQCRWLALLVVSAMAGYTQQIPPGGSPQGYRIAGVVVNSLTGQPIADASVGIAPTANADGDEVLRSVTTGSDGRFAIAGLARGKYSLMATARGFSEQFFEHHGNFATAIAVGPDLDSEGLVFRLDPDSAVEGAVADDGGEPVQNAMVRLFEQRLQDGQHKTVLMNQVQTDDRGQYHFGHLLPGTYYVAVSARPWWAQQAGLPVGPGTPARDAVAAQEVAALNATYPLTFYPSSPDSAGASPIVLKAGERATADVVMRAVPAITLRVRTPYVQKGPGSFYMSGPQVSQPIFEGQLIPVLLAVVGTGEPGLQVVSLPPGHYVLKVEPLNDAGASNHGWYQEIDLTADTELNAAAAPGFATVAGSVAFQGASEVPANTFLLLSKPATGETFRSAISSKGELHFGSDGITPGRYNVLLENSHGFALNQILASGAKVTGRTLEITAAGAVTLKCIASRGIARVEGVAQRDGKPVTGAMIVLVPRDLANNLPLVRRDQSDSDGTFTLSNVVPGEYKVVAIANGWDLAWSEPSVIQPYLKAGTAVHITGDGKVEVKVEVQ